MNVKYLIDKYDFKVLAGGKDLTGEIKNVYIGDLLSWVMGNAEEGCVWITIQGHLNVIAVATLVSASCIIVCENAVVTKDTIDKADYEGVPILTTSLTSYEVAKIFVKEDV